MKRPLLLRPLLALALPSLAQDPATNAVAAKEAAVRAKLDAIVFDSLEYQDANAADVISDLCERAREMDKDEPDPAKKGVSVVVGVDVKDIDEILARTTVTLKERSVSLGAALDRVADAIGLKVRVVGGCVLLGIYKGPLEFRIFPVPPDLASRFLGDGNDWKARFAEIGIEWPDGTYVRYLMSVGRLTVYNTPDDLDRIERALAEAAPSPAEDDLTAAVRAKLDRIIVEKVEWQQKNIADAIADLGDFSRQFDPETDIRKHGVGFTLDLGEAPSEADLPRLTVRLHRVTLHSLLDLVADMADLEYRIEGGRVVLRRKDAESAELAASAREEDNDEKVQDFLRRIEEPGLIPELEWRDASVEDVARFLTDCSLVLNPGTFEERGGVHFTTYADHEDFPTGAVPRVSAVAKSVTLGQAAHLVAEAAGWRVTVYPESRTIRIGPSWSCGPTFFMADASPEFAAAAERELPVAENPNESARLRSFLAARGVRWSESDEAQLRSDIGKLVFTVAEEDTARLIQAILAAPGFALRRIPVRAKVVSIEGDPTRFGLGGRDSALTIRTISTEDLAEIAAAFDAGAEVTALEPLQAEEGLPAIWKQVSSPAPGFEALVVLTPAADGEGRRVHFVLRSFPPDADAETVAPHGCAGDAALAPGEALLVGVIPVAGSPDRSLALLLEFPDTQSPEEEKTHAENAEPKPLSLAAKLQP